MTSFFKNPLTSNDNAMSSIDIVRQEISKVFKNRAEAEKLGLTYSEYEKALQLVYEQLKEEQEAERNKKIAAAADTILANIKTKETK